MKQRSNHNTENSSVFLGYDLPDYITKDDVMSFMIKFQHLIVDVEVVSNKRWGNYAKVTFQTASDAHMAMNYYNGRCWFELDLIVCLKPWKGSSRAKKVPNPVVQTTYNDDEVASYLPPYPGNSCTKIGSSIISSQPGKAGVKKLASYYTSCENLAEIGYKKCELQYASCDNLTTGLYEHRYTKEYTIKLSGLKMNVTKQEITELVAPFGELTSPIKIVSYPKNRVCYAYANFCIKQSAVTAVSELNKRKFGDRMIHVCHKGELEVVHSCIKELEVLANSELSSYDPDIASKGTLLKDGGKPLENANIEIDKSQTSTTFQKPTYLGIRF